MGKYSFHIQNYKNIFLLLLSSEPIYQKHDPGKKLINFITAKMLVSFLLPLPVSDSVLVLEKLLTKGKEMFLAISV